MVKLMTSIKCHICKSMKKSRLWISRNLLKLILNIWNNWAIIKQTILTNKIILLITLIITNSKNIMVHKNIKMDTN